MKWQNREGSRNIEDHRKRRMRRIGGGIGIGTILMVLLGLFLGQDPMSMLNQIQTQSVPDEIAPGNYQSEDVDKPLVQFVSVVLKDNEDVWSKLFRENFNKEYPQPKLVIYSGMDRSGCGVAQTATGPFYCPADQKVYLDLSFFREMKSRFNAPGDFAMAYVVAHEIGHHVQNLFGITDQVARKRAQMSKRDGNRMSVRLELQADYLAGVWAHHNQKMNHILEKGDVEEAVNAAASVGDDRIQKSAGSYVMPDAFTHGTSEQRVRWFMKGLQSGDMRGGDTFSVPYERL